MGRNRIKIEKIENERSRQATFTKRKNGLVKKAMELSILCDCQVALIIFGPGGKMYQYSSQSMESLLLKYTEAEDSTNSLTNADYNANFGSSSKEAPEPSHKAALHNKLRYISASDHRKQSSSSTNTQEIAVQSSGIQSNLGLSNDPLQYVLTPRTAMKYKSVNKRYENMLLGADSGVRYTRSMAMADKESQQIVPSPPVVGQPQFSLGSPLTSGASASPQEQAMGAIDDRQRKAKRKKVLHIDVPKATHAPQIMQITGDEAKPLEFTSDEVSGGRKRRFSPRRAIPAAAGTEATSTSSNLYPPSFQIFPSGGDSNFNQQRQGPTASLVTPSMYYPECALPVNNQNVQGPPSQMPEGLTPSDMTPGSRVFASLTPTTAALLYPTPMWQP